MMVRRKIGMKKFRDRFFLGLMCIVLGVFIAVQVKMVHNDLLHGNTPIQRSVILKKELSTVQAEKEALKEKLDTYEKQLSGIEESASEDNAIIKNLNEELEEYKTLAGLTTVKGPGIKIYLDDPPSDLDGDNAVLIYRYDYLVRIINFLNSGGAEAISVNGQRIINNSEIVLSGNSLRINSVPVAPPITISAIGNPDTLKSSIDWMYGVVWEMREHLNIQVDIKKFDEITIERYNEVIKFKHLKNVEEE